MLIPLYKALCLDQTFFKYMLLQLQGLGIREVSRPIQCPLFNSVFSFEITIAYHTLNE